MNIKIEVNRYDDKNIQLWGIEVNIYAKSDVQAKEIAKKFIDQIPENDTK